MSFASEKTHSLQNSTAVSCATQIIMFQRDLALELIHRIFIDGERKPSQTLSEISLQLTKLYFRSRPYKITLVEMEFLWKSVIFSKIDSIRVCIRKVQRGLAPQVSSTHKVGSKCLPKCVSQHFLAPRRGMEPRSPA